MLWFELGILGPVWSAQTMDQDMNELVGIDLGCDRHVADREIDESKVIETMVILIHHLGSFGGEFLSTLDGRGFIHALASAWFPQKDHELVLDWVDDEVNEVVRLQVRVLLRPNGDRELLGKVRQDLKHPTFAIMIHLLA